MSGVLGVFPRQLAVNSGAFVAGAKLFVYESTLTTKRAIYTTSALSVQHSNPLVADSNGRFATFYIDPSGGAYKLVLASSSDTDPPTSPIWTDDVIPATVPAEALPSSVATIIEGNFTGTLTGYASNPTGTVNYRITANAAGTGKVCQLWVDEAIGGTSNADTMTLTGLPAACQSSRSVWVSTAIRDNSNYNHATAFIDSATPSVIAFWTDANLSPTGFTTSGTKALPGGWNITYAL